MIDTKAIRDRILLLALKGELVEQDPQDEPASELINELCKNMKGTSLEQDFSEDEIPYDIPSSWAWCRLSDVGSTNIGLTYHPDDVTSNGVIVARSSNIVNGKMDYSDLVKVSCSIRENQYLNNNDILICARNGSKALVGKCAIYQGESQKIAFGAFMAVYRSPLFRYVYYYFNTDVFKRNFISDDSKQINQVTQSILKQSLIPIPPLSEQTRIVQRIESIFEILDKIDALQEQYASNQEVLKSKLIDAAIQGRLTEQLPEDGFAEELYQQIQGEKKKLEKEGKIKKEKKAPEINEDELPFEIPLTWKWVRLSEIGLLQTGTTPSKSNPNYFGDYIPFVSPGEIQDNVITRYDKQGLSESGAAVARVVEKDSVLQVCIGGSIGKTAINDRAITFNQQINSVTPYIMNHEYIFYCLTSNYFISRITMASAGAATPIINKTNWGNLVIPLAPLAEQDRIVEKLNGLFVNLSE